MYHVLTCKNYRTIYSTHSPEDALRFARANRQHPFEEFEYANIIMKDSRIVGDCVEGFHNREPEPLPDWARNGGVLHGREW